MTHTCNKWCRAQYGARSLINGKRELGMLHDYGDDPMPDIGYGIGVGLSVGFTVLIIMLALGGKL